MNLHFTFSIGLIYCNMALAQVDPIKASFQTCPNDSAFVTARTKDGQIIADFDMTYTDENYAPYLLTLKKSPLGTVVGPVDENGKKVYYKLTAADSIFEFHVAHILVTHSMHATNESKNLIDQAYAKLKSGASTWTELVDEYGEDGTVEREGDLGWSLEIMFVPSFAAACAALKKGEYSVVETDYGWHLIWMKSAPRRVRQHIHCMRLAI
jgi:peptidyl-prolyl cis-trans isomerase D